MQNSKKKRKSLNEWKVQGSRVSASGADKKDPRAIIDHQTTIQEHAGTVASLSAASYMPCDKEGEERGGNLLKNLKSL